MQSLRDQIKPDMPARNNCASLHSTLSAGLETYYRKVIAAPATLRVSERPAARPRRAVEVSPEISIS